MANIFSDILRPVTGPVLTAGVSAPAKGVLVPSWVQRNPSGAEPVFSFDYDANRYRYLGATYATETAANSAIGFTKSGITRVTNAPIVTSETNLLDGIIAVDGSATTGLTAFGTGASLAAVGGEVEFTGGGTSNGFRTSVTLDLATAYRITWEGRRGTGTQNGFLQASLNGSLSGGTSGTPGTTSTTQISAVAEFGVPAATTYLGWTIVGTASGTQYFDDVDLRALAPFEGFAAGSAEVMVDFTTPASGASLQVLYQEDANNARDRFGVTYDPATGEVRMRVTQNNSAMANILLGTVGAAERHKVTIAAALNNFAGSLDGKSVANNAGADTSGTMPGVSRARIGTSPAAETFTGTIHKVARYNGRTRRSEGGIFRDPFIEFLSAENPIWMTGDSYANNVQGVGLVGTIYTETGRGVISTGINGRTLTGILADVQSSQNNFLRGLPLIVWDGRANGHTNGAITLEQGLYAQIAASAGRVMILPPLAVPNDSPDYVADMDAIYAWLVAQGIPTVNVKAIAAGLATSPGDDADVTAGVIPRSLMIDPTLTTDADHIGQTLTTAVYNQIAIEFASLGW